MPDESEVLALLALMLLNDSRRHARFRDDQIALLLGVLSRLTESPVVDVNRAVAVAETDGPEAALDILDALDLDDYRYLHSTRAALLRRLGRDDEARLAYEDALKLTAAGPEHRFLAMRLSELLPSSERDE